MPTFKLSDVLLHTMRDTVGNRRMLVIKINAMVSSRKLRSNIRDDQRVELTAMIMENNLKPGSVLTAEARSIATWLNTL